MRIQNSTNNSFKGSITISRLNKDPNSEMIISAIGEAVNSFVPKAEEYDCKLFKGIYINPLTMAQKIIISTGSDAVYFQKHGKAQTNKKIKEIDLALLAKIKSIKAKLKTENVSGACLIDMPPIDEYTESGLTEIKKGITTVGVTTSGNRHWLNYKFIQQPDGGYLSLYKKTFADFKEGVIFDF